MSVSIEMLGPLRVRVDGVEVSLGGAKQRTVLASLALRLGRDVALDQLIDQVWEHEPPGRPEANIQVYVSQLRKVLDAPGEESCIRNEGRGYRLVLPPDAVDLHRVTRELEEVERVLSRQDLDRLATTTRGLVAAFRGTAGVDLADGPLARQVRTSAAELRARAVETHARVDLGRGQPETVLLPLRELCEEDPTRESAWELLALALYRSGQQAAALAALREAEEYLRDEQGLDLGPELRDLRQRLLVQEASLQVSTESAVPAPPAEVVGREEAVAELVALLASRRLVTLIGPGGVGKTCLALCVAQRVEGRVTFADLTTATDRSAAETLLLSALGGVDLPGALAAASGLLVLDNLEQLGDASELVAEVLRRSRLTVLATSREPLRVAEQRAWPVSPLSEDHAVALFRTRSADAGAQAVDDEDVREICQRLDGLPLALELAAAQTRALEPADLLARLDGALDLLTDGRVGHERHTSLRAAIAWSVDLLTEAERELLVGLSALPGPATATRVEDVLGPVLPALMALVDKGLVRVLDGKPRRYDLMVSVRQYARDLLAPRQEERIRDRHLEVVCAPLRLGLHDSLQRRADLMAMCRADLVHVRAAWSWVVERELDASDFPVVFFDTLNEDGYFEESARVVREALTRTTRLEVHYRLLEALFNAGDDDAMPGEVARFRSRQGTSADERALIELTAFFALTDVDEARAHAVVMRDLLKNLGEPTMNRAWLLATLHNLLSVMLAYVDPEQALASAEIVASSKLWIFADGTLASMYREQGLIEEAEQFLAQTMTDEYRALHPASYAYLQVMLGSVRLHRGDTAQARELTEAARATFLDLGIDVYAQSAVMGLAPVAKAEGDLLSAETCLMPGNGGPDMEARLAWRRARIRRLRTGRPQRELLEQSWSVLQGKWAMWLPDLMGCLAELALLEPTPERLALLRKHHGPWLYPLGVGEDIERLLADNP